MPKICVMLRSQMNFPEQIILLVLHGKNLNFFIRKDLLLKTYWALLQQFPILNDFSSLSDILPHNSVVREWSWDIIQDYLY